MARARVRDPLADPLRVTMLRATGLLGTPKEEAFDRLAGLARKVLDAPIAMVTLVDETHVHAKSCAGARDLVARGGRTPVKDTFCQHVVRAGEPVVIEDAREHDVAKGMAVVKSGKALAYAGVPLTLQGGFVAGTLCVADTRPRAWTGEQVAILEDLARCVLTEIEVRADAEARKQAENDLKRSTERLRGLMDNSPTVIAAKDLEGRYLFLNRAAEEMLGVTEADAIGRTDEQLFPPALAAALREHDAAVVAGGAPIEVEETLDTAVYRSVRFPLTDEAGEPYGVCGISTDVSEGRRTEQALHAARQRSASTFELAPTGMAMVGTDGRFQQVNAALAELAGRSEAELLGATLADVVHPDEWAARKRLFERMLTGEIRTHQTQGRLLPRDGEPRWVLVNATALTDAEGWPTEFFVQFQDITEQTRGQQLLAARHDVTRVLAQAATVEQAAPVLRELGSAKALLRRLETAVDAAQDALSSALPDDK